MLSALLFLVYNANGREVGAVDSQAAKFFARDIVVHHTLTLDPTVAAQPLYGERAAFARDREGHWRPAYGVVPGLVAAVPAAVLHTAGLVDLSSPLAPNLIGAFTASLLTSAAVGLLFLTLRRSHTEGVALATSVAVGLGTNYWGIVSQTLWQHECVAFGISLTLWAWWRIDPPRWTSLVAGGLGLALAGAARMQVAPMVAVLLIWACAQFGWRRAWIPVMLVGLVASAEIARNLSWFGHPLGASVVIESLHPQLHDVPGPVAAAPWINAVALLVSPARGLLVYSPIALLAVLGVWAAFRRSDSADLRWLAVAAAVQFVVYACYAVWWAGHTYGPRYLMDIVMLLAPLGALGTQHAVQRVSTRRLAAAALVWSIAVSALGAFVYPNERWNTTPMDVDKHHERLWDWKDSQITRALRSRPSPQNFNLFSRAAVRPDRT